MNEKVKKSDSVIYQGKDHKFTSFIDRLVPNITLVVEKIIERRLKEEM